MKYVRMFLLSEKADSQVFGVFGILCIYLHQGFFEQYIISE